MNIWDVDWHRHKMGMAMATGLFAALAAFSYWRPRIYTVEWDAASNIIDNPTDLPLRRPDFGARWHQKHWRVGTTLWQHAELPNGNVLQVKTTPAPGNTLPTFGEHNFEILLYSPGKRTFLGRYLEFKNEYRLNDIRLSPDGRFIGVAWGDGDGYILDATNLRKRRDIRSLEKRHNSINYRRNLAPEGWRSNVASRMYVSKDSCFAYFVEPRTISVYRIKWF